MHNIVVYSRPEAHLIFSWRNQPGMFAECDNNLYWLRGADVKAMESTPRLPAPSPSGKPPATTPHSLVADPLFVDAAHDDYPPQARLPAPKLGFKAIPVEKIGPKGFRERNTAVSSRNSYR